MSSRDVLAELTEVILQVTELDPAEVQPDRLFVDELRIDSLAMVEILEGTARRFDVRIEDEDAKHFVRVRDLTSYVDERLRAKP
jgi:acyl carrier protein